MGVAQTGAIVVFAFGATAFATGFVAMIFRYRARRAAEHANEHKTDDRKHKEKDVEKVKSWRRWSYVVLAFSAVCLFLSVLFFAFGMEKVVNTGYDYALNDDSSPTRSGDLGFAISGMLLNAGTFGCYVFYIVVACTTERVRTGNEASLLNEPNPDSYYGGVDQTGDGCCVTM